MFQLFYSKHILDSLMCNPFFYELSYFGNENVVRSLSDVIHIYIYLEANRITNGLFYSLFSFFKKAWTLRPNVNRCRDPFIM